MTQTAIVSIDTIDQLPIEDIFSKGGIKPVLDAIDAEVSSQVPDLSTDKGRKAIASLARKVSSTKVALDAMGKKLADGYRAKLDPINAERKLAKDTLEALRDKIRQPLTDWEQEQERIEAERQAVIEAEKLAKQVIQDHEVALLLDAEFDRQREEERKAAEAAAEHARIEQQEREERLQKEAAAKAKADAERAAQERQQYLIREKEDAERARIVAEERAKLEAVQAKQRQEAAIEAERQRVAEEQRRQKQETEAREANKKHRAKVHGDAKAALVTLGLTDLQAKDVVLAIRDNKVPNVSIQY